MVGLNGLPRPPTKNCRCRVRMITSKRFSLLNSKGEMLHSALLVSFSMRIRASTLSPRHMQFYRRYLIARVFMITSTDSRTESETCLMQQNGMAESRDLPETQIVPTHQRPT